MDDIDIFANIDSYLNTSQDLEVQPPAAAPPAATDLSDVTTPEAHNSRARKSSRRNVGRQPIPLQSLDAEDNDEDLNAADGPPRDLTPGKGQKTAFERFNKLKKNLQRHVISSALPTSTSPIGASVDLTFATNVTTTSTGRAARPTRSRRQRQVIAVDQPAPVAIIDLSDDDGASHRIEPIAKPPSAAAQHNSSLQDVFEEENYTMQVKVKWCSSAIETMPLRRHQPFAELCALLAQRDATVAAESVVLVMGGDRIVRHDETPDSVGYTIGKLISARPIDADLQRSMGIGVGPETGSGSGASGSGGANSGTTIELKIQSSLWKRPILLSMEPHKKMMVLVILCAQRLKCAPERLRLRFDGEALDLHQTAEELELEGGEVMDLWMTEE